MADNEKVDLDALLGLTDDDEVTTPVAEEPIIEEPVEKKTRAPRKQRATVVKEPEEVVAEPGHVPTETINPTEVETPEQRRIRELEAALTRPALKSTSDDAGRPLPESQLDADQRRIRDLEDRLARKHAEEAETSESRYIAPTGNGETLLIHFLEDGLLVNGTTTYTGQEMEFDLDGPAYKQTLNRRGESFLDLVDDIDAQWDRWGKQMFARGAWRGRKWGDTSTISDAQAKADAQAAARIEARRGRSAPIASF